LLLLLARPAWLLIKIPTHPETRRFTARLINEYTLADRREALI
jgi:hypothetical protein